MGEIDVVARLKQHPAALKVQLAQVGRQFLKDGAGQGRQEAIGSEG
jgi:hypothetical protein